VAYTNKGLFAVLIHMKTGLTLLLIALTTFPALSQGYPRIPIYRPDSTRYYKGRMRCTPRFDQTLVGLDYGVSNNIFGVKASTFVPWQFGIPLMLNPEVTWRIPRNGSSYFSLDLIRRYGPKVGKMSLMTSSGYKRNVTNFEATGQIYVGLGLSTWTSSVSLGYARQRGPGMELNPANVNGVILQLYSEFWEQLDIKTSAIWWFNQLQYALAIREQLFQSRFAIGVGYERIGAWSEFDVSLVYGY
jgi:hypothetical protein